MEFIMSDEMKKALNVEEKKKNEFDKIVSDSYEKGNNTQYHLASDFLGKREKRNKIDKLTDEVISYIQEHTISIEDDSDFKEEIVTFKEFVWLVKNDYIITYSKLENNDYNRIKIKYHISRNKRKNR